MLLSRVLNNIYEIVYCQSNYKIFFRLFKSSTGALRQFKITMIVLLRLPLSDISIKDINDQGIIQAI